MCLPMLECHLGRGEGVPCILKFEGKWLDGALTCVQSSHSPPISLIRQLQRQQPIRDRGA